MEQFYYVYFLVLSIAGLVLLFNFIPAFYFSMKLYFHLLAKRREQFKKTTSIVGALGIGGSNPFKWFPYIYNDEDFDDVHIKKMKLRIRPRLRGFLLVFAVIILLLAADIIFL